MFPWLCFDPATAPRSGVAEESLPARSMGQRTKNKKSRLVGRKLGGRHTNAVGVAVEKHALGFAPGSLGGFHPLADAGAVPHGLEESSPAGVGFGAVVLAHDLLDGLAGLVGVVEGNVADIVVEDVSLDDTVEDVATDEAEIAVNGGGGTTGEVPHLGLVVRKTGVGVLKVGDGN